MHAPYAPLPLDGLAGGEPTEREDGLLEAGESRGRRADRGDRAVPRAQPESRAPGRQLVHARDGAGRHHEMPREGIGDEGADVAPPRVERGQAERDVELAEYRLGVGHADPFEAALLRLRTQLAEAGERLRKEHDAEARRDHDGTR